MPSGWQSFPVNICQVCCRSSNTFSHLRRPTSVLLTSRISSAAISTPVVPHLHPCAHPTLSSLLKLYSIPIISHLHRISILILPHLCCGSHRIIFHRTVYFAIVVCQPSRILSSPHSALFCTTLIAPLFSALIFSLSTLIFSLIFPFLFWHGYSLSP